MSKLLFTWHENEGGHKGSKSAENMNEAYLSKYEVTNSFSRLISYNLYH